MLAARSVHTVAAHSCFDSVLATLFEIE